MLFTWGMTTIGEMELVPPAPPSSWIKDVRPVGSSDLEVLSPVGSSSTCCQRINLFHVSIAVYTLMVIGIIMGVMYVVTDVFD